jgi:hypothetical protein
MDEATIQQQIQIEGVQYGSQLMRNNSGAFKDASGRWVRYGLGNVSKKQSEHIKSSDLIGFTRVIITQEMVGKMVAVFTAVEVKSSDKKPTADKRYLAQNAFLVWVLQNGGLAGFANSIETFRKIIGV